MVRQHDSFSTFDSWANKKSNNKMEKISFRDLQRRLKEVDPRPVAGEGITKKVLQERWEKYQREKEGRREEKLEPETKVEEGLVKAMEKLSIKPKRRPRKGEIDLYGILSPHLDLVPDMRPMKTVSLMKDVGKKQNTLGLFEDELNALTTLDDQETEEERRFIQALIEKSGELYRYIDQFSHVVDRFVEKYPVIFTSLLYAFSDRMDEIILSSTDERLAKLPLLHDMVRERLDHKLTPWLLRSFRYMEEMDVISSSLNDKAELNENDHIATSLLVGLTRSRLLYIVKKNLPYKFFANTITTFFSYVGNTFGLRGSVVDIIIDNVSYLDLWLDIAHLFVEYTSASYIWVYFEHLLRTVVTNTIKLDKPSLLFRLLDDSLFQYNAVPHLYELSEIIIEGEKTLQWPSVIRRIIGGRSANSGDQTYYTIEPLAYIFSTLNLEAMEQYWNLVSSDTAFMEDLFSPFVENSFWYNVNHFVILHGRSFPSKLVETIIAIADNPIYYMPNVIGLLYEIAKQDSYGGKGWQEVFDSLLPLMSDDAISILLTMVVRNPKAGYTQEEERLRDQRVGHAWLTSKLREIKKTKYYLDALREEGRKRNIASNPHLQIMNAEQVRM